MSEWSTYVVRSPSAKFKNNEKKKVILRVLSPSVDSRDTVEEYVLKTCGILQHSPFEVWTRCPDLTSVSSELSRRLR